MANPHRGEMSFDADGAAYTLHFSTNAICELEEKLDRSFISIARDLESASTNPDKIRFTTMRAIFWAGLRDHHPSLDLKAAGDLMIAAGGLAAVMALITEAFTRAFPAPESKDARPPNGGLPGSGTGLASLSSGKHQNTARVTSSGSSRRAS